MKKRINVLSIVLVLQLGLVFLTGLEKKESVITGKFITSNLSGADKIKLTVDDGSLVLQKKSDSWVLPEKQDLPVEIKKVSAFIQEFSELNKTDLVGSSKETHKSLKLEDSGFSRKVDFFSSDKTLVEVLLGNSSAFKRIFSRVKGTNEVYEIPFNEYRLSVDPMDWVKRDLLQISGEVKSFSVNDINLTNTEGKWTNEKLKPEDLNQEEVAKLVSRLTSIGFDSVALDIKESEFNKIAKFLEFTLDNGEKNTFTFVGPYQTEFLLLKTSKYPYIFKVVKSNIDGIKAQVITSLKKEK